MASEDAIIYRQIQELEKAAAAVLATKRKLRDRRPIVIEFAGSPKSGKSSCISSLDIFLRRNKFRTKVLTERASVSPIENKLDPLFNIWTACASLNQLTDVLCRESKSLDIVILDRGFFDTLVWFEWQKNNRFLRSEDYNNFTSFFTTPRFRMMLDLVILFDCDPQTSADREYKNLLTRKEGSIMRPSVLNGYRTAASKVMEKYASLFRGITKYDTSKIYQNDVSYGVTKEVLNKLKEVADEKIGFVSEACFKKVSQTVFRYSNIQKSVENCLSFEFREEVEKNKELVQFIPIAVIKDQKSERFLTARKALKAMSEHSPERDRLLLYFGGHVREEDKTCFPAPSDLDVFKQCLYREVKEEIGLDVDAEEHDPFCIWVRDGSKSNNHIAIVFVIERDIDQLKVMIDEDEFVRGEKKAFLPTGTIADVAELKRRASTLDTWSQNILREILHIDISKKQRNNQPRLFDPR
jgi:predicted NUDIX family phosphoesterase/thymidylate kinase